MATRINTFDDWMDLFKAWQKDINLDTAQLGDYKYEVKFAEPAHPEIEFGAYAGQRKWENVMEIPDQRIRDALLNLIRVQGDTEFASTEQQRFLFDHTPADDDRRSLARIICEESRHGWQMAYLLVIYFGATGKVEAQKLLERRAFKKTRLLGSFNQEINNWLDLLAYTEFVDRDGKHQLKMESFSAFAPFARSLGPMLKEEQFHLGFGHNGLKRILRAGKIPVSLIQKYFNKWIPTAYDLFGTDHSSSAHWAYTWGIKGRFDEDVATDSADLAHLNERARALFYDEIAGLVDNLNLLIADDQAKLYVPDMRFDRRIGDFAQQPYSVTGERLSEEVYARHLAEALPSAEDEVFLQNLLKDNGWIAPRGAGLDA
jgi:benzoyl-CoA 2,3-dioxygenase component B